MGVRPAFPTLEPAVQSALTRFDAGTILSALEREGLVAKGRVHLISVEAIRVAFADRWRHRKALVWDMAETLILKMIGERDFMVRLSDVDFAIITPRLDPRESQALAVRISRRILTHFLGESRSDNIAIKIVTAYRDQTITCERLTEADLREAIVAAGPARAAKGAKLSGAVTAADGLRLTYSTYTDPIVDLSRWAIAGHRIEPRVAYESTGVALSSEARRKLLPRDVEAFDRATLARGLERLRAAAPAARTTLILRVSFLTVSNTKTRGALFDMARDAKAEMQKSVIWEIADFDAGVPGGLLHECVSLLQPYARAVFTSAEAATLAALAERSGGRCGLIFQPSAEFEDEDDDEASAWLLATGRVALKRSATLVAANLPSKSLLPLASSVGFTHATVRRPRAA